MIGHLYPLLLAPRGAPPADRFDYLAVLQQRLQQSPQLARMAAHMRLVQRARQSARRR